MVVGGGHAGVEAAWAAANMLGPDRPQSVALVTLDPSKIGVMSCNPAIGGLAKGQLVREIDAMGGLMGLAADATGIHFKVLNRSKGQAVWGPRCQSDKVAYARAIRAHIEQRPEIEIIGGVVDRMVLDAAGHICGVEVSLRSAGRTPATASTQTRLLRARAVVLTTGTFMRGLMHSGPQQTPGGRVGEDAVSTVSSALRELGFELGRLKTGTPPRLRRGSLDWEALPADHGDAQPVPFSELTDLRVFPLTEQIACRQTYTTPEAHDLIRANIHRAPMFSGQIESVGPRYCPSIEDKVVRFADRDRHGVFLEPESHSTDWVYCNGIATSLPIDVQEQIVRTMPGCANAEVLRFGYAVEYDMVRPHQIRVTGETKLVPGLFLAGQINGTSGYEEAAAQGLVAGINAVRSVQDLEPFVFGRDESYIGVLMDDLVTKTPVEPYRMFTSRAEHRLLLRADNAPDRLTPRAIDLGLLTTTEAGHMRIALFERRRTEISTIARAVGRTKVNHRPLDEVLRRAESSMDTLRAAVENDAEIVQLLGDQATGRVGAMGGVGEQAGIATASWFSAHADVRYASYVERQRAEVRRHAEMERRKFPSWLPDTPLPGLRTEARLAIARFRPDTFGQASRLEGITPADLTLLAVLAKRGPATAQTTGA